MTTQGLVQVKASAGSGKTYELTSRFLALLHKASAERTAFVCTNSPMPDSAHYALPEIMAVTFTNKAAAEMKQRVVATLKRRALDLDTTETGPAGQWTPQEASGWLTHIVRHYHQLNIHTIDSLLHGIMRLFAVETGLAPDFAIALSTLTIYPELYERLTQRAAQGDERVLKALESAFECLLSLEEREGFFLDSVFEQRLLKLLNFRLENALKTGNNGTEIETDPVHIQDALKKHCTCLNEASQAMAAVLDNKKYAALTNFCKLLDKCTRLTPADRKLPSATYAKKAALAQCLKKASQQEVTPACEAVYAHFTSCFTQYEKLYPLLTGARNLSGFLPVSTLLLEELTHFEQENNTLLLSQCARYAARLLQSDFGVPDAFCRMGSRLNHILVDEFQDTGKDQWEALLPLAIEALSRRGTLFYVGDVKQAIYGWRGGEARLFDAVVEDEELTCMADPVQKHLPYNWRSLYHIVQWNNHIFGQLEEAQKARTIASILLDKAPETEKEKLAGQIQQVFTGSTQKVPEGNKSNSGYVRVHKVHADNKAGMMEAAHEVLAELFSTQLRLRRPGDIAVLVRRNDEGAEVARWLVELGWPVLTKNSLNLADHPVIRQLVCLLNFLEYPLDDMALWEFISGQEIFGKATGLSRTDLASWLASETKSPLYTAFQHAFPDEYTTHIEKFLQHAGLMSAYDMSCELVSHFHLLENNPDQELFIRRFLEVVHTAEQAGHQSLACFLHYWKQTAAEEKVPLSEHIDAVRIMTIHDAKGLEFPVVVVPFHHWTSKPHNEYALCDIAGMQLFAPLRKELGTVYYEQLSLALLEQLNLLYVAWTRPVEELYCLLTTTTKSRNAPFPAALAALLEQQFPESTGNTVAEYGTAPTPTSQQTISPDTSCAGAAARTVTPTAPTELTETARPDYTAKPMDWLPRLKIHRHFSGNLSRSELLGPACAATVFNQRTRGQLMHSALEALHMLLTHNPDQPDRTKTAVHIALQQHKNTLPQAENEQQDIQRQCTATLDWLLTLPHLADWIRHGNAECSLIDAAGMEHRPDLLVWQKETATIVEYKTGQPAPEHQQQVRRYLQLLQAMPEGPKYLSGLLIYLDEHTTQAVSVALGAV